MWTGSLCTLLEVVDDLERQIAAIEVELRLVARTDQRAQLLITIPGLGGLLALTIAAAIGEVARFPSARKLIGYAGLAPTIKQSGQSSWTGLPPSPLWLGAFGAWRAESGGVQVATERFADEL